MKSSSAEFLPQEVPQQGISPVRAVLALTFLQIGVAATAKTLGAEIARKIFRKRWLRSAGGVSEKWSRLIASDQESERYIVSMGDSRCVLA